MKSPKPTVQCHQPSIHTTHFLTTCLPRALSYAPAPGLQNVYPVTIHCLSLVMSLVFITCFLHLIAFDHCNTLRGWQGKDIILILPEAQEQSILLGVELRQGAHLAATWVHVTQPSLEYTQPLLLQGGVETMASVTCTSASTLACHPQGWTT